MGGQDSRDLDLMRGHKGPVKAYVQRNREGSTHIYSLLINISFCPFSCLLFIYLFIRLMYKFLVCVAKASTVNSTG
jgi:hypothetical protein